MPSTWDRDDIQFPRLIAELEAAGAFTDDVMDSLCDSMDLAKGDLCELIDRAVERWDEIKANTDAAGYHGD